MKRGRPAPLIVAPHAQVEIRRQQDQWRRHPGIPELSFYRALRAAYRDIQDFPGIGAEYHDGGVTDARRHLMNTKHWLYYAVDRVKQDFLHPEHVYVLWIKGSWLEDPDAPTQLKRARSRLICW